MMNIEQQAAANHHEGPALVVAGAGTGKTRTVIERIANLIQNHKVHATRIMAVTFTAKAAGELEERLAARLGEDASGVWVATFHAAANRIVKAYSSLVGLRPGYVVYTDYEIIGTIREIQKTIPALRSTKTTELKTIIELGQSNLWDAHDLQKNLATKNTIIPTELHSLPAQPTATLYAQYEQQLRSMNTTDFGLLINHAITILQNHPEIRRAITTRSEFLHVDEYQDTNHAQYVFTQLLLTPKKNLMVVGDPDQSIYAFRGANLNNILSFTQDHPTAITYKLERNYRNAPHIIHAANHMILNNAERLEKTLVPTSSATAKPRVHTAADEVEEARYIARNIEALTSDDLNYDDVVILYRTNTQARTLELGLREAGIPSRTQNQAPLTSHQDVQHLLVFTRAITNQHDHVAWRAALQASVKNTRVQNKLISESIKSRGNLKSVISQHLKAEEHAELRAFQVLTEKYAALIHELSASEFIREFTTELDVHWKNEIKDLIAYAEAIEGTTGFTFTPDFLDEVALHHRPSSNPTPGATPTPTAPAVTLMTLHQAKGLEYPIVFLAGTEEGLLPNTNSDEAGTIEEERRLFYVGITRAQEHLIISNAKTRSGKNTTPSRYIKELPENHITTDNGEPALPKTSSTTLEYDAGDTINHQEWGEGVVASIQNIGATLISTVIFLDASVGIKQFEGANPAVSPA